MEFLQDVFGEEALSFAEFGKRLEAREDIKLANLAAGEYVGAEKYKALNGQLARQQAEFEQQLAELHFNGELEREIAAQGGRSSRAVAAFLDTDALCREEDVPGAVQAAVRQLKATAPYLFKEDKPAPYAEGTGTAPLMPDAYKQALGIN